MNSRLCITSFCSLWPVKKRLHLKFLNWSANCRQTTTSWNSHVVSHFVCGCDFLVKRMHAMYVRCSDISGWNPTDRTALSVCPPDDTQKNKEKGGVLIFLQLSLLFLVRKAIKGNFFLGPHTRTQTQKKSWRSDHLYGSLLFLNFKKLSFRKQHCCVEQ